MKHKYSLLIVAGLAFGLAACQKLDSNPSNASIIGKWQETKLHMYWDSSGTIKDDTTYLASTFNSADFAQFNSDSTCTIGTSHLYYPAMGLYAKNGPYITTTDFRYAAAGSKFILYNQIVLFNPAGFVTTDSVVNHTTNTLQIHSTFTQGNIANKTVSDVYYTKQ